MPPPAFNERGSDAPVPVVQLFTGPPRWGGFAMRIDVLTLFPEMFAGVLGSSILKRAAEAVPTGPDKTQVREPVVSYHVTDIRQFTQDKHGKVDQAPFGGGPGMLIQCQPVWDAVQAVEAQDPRPATRVLMTPQGKPLTQAVVADLAKRERLVILAGHYEGFDERVLDALEPMEHVSLGDYVLSGGELPAMVLIDAIVRLLPGALGDAESAEKESFSTDLGGMLDYPHYTRPREWMGREAPAVLLSGDHAKIEAWRREQAAKRTRERRPDLMGTGGGEATAGRPAVVVVREEEKADLNAIDQVHREAFPTEAEAKLVRDLRKAGDLVISVVAEVDVGGRTEVVGHVAVSPMTLVEQASVRGLLGMGPVAVRPGWQGRGVGAALVREAIRRAKLVRALAVFVLGEPAYYGRFGFEPATGAGFTGDYPESGGAFQVLVLREGLPEHVRGQVRYARAFADLAE